MRNALRMLPVIPATGNQSSAAGRRVLAAVAVANGIPNEAAAPADAGVALGSDNNVWPTCDMTVKLTSAAGNAVTWAPWTWNPNAQLWVKGSERTAIVPAGKAYVVDAVSFAIVGRSRAYVEIVTIAAASSFDAWIMAQEPPQ